MDSLILAAQIFPSRDDRILDVGCGCGILGLILAGRHPDVTVTGVEIQETLAGLARKNVILNRMQDRVRILQTDIRTLSGEPYFPSADWVVANPPYQKKNTGRLNPDPEKALARHEITLDIDTLVNRARRFLRPKGRLCLIFPAVRAPDLTAALDREGFHLDWVRPVHYSATAPARRIVVCAGTSAFRTCSRRPGLVLYRPDGRPTTDHLSLFQW